MNEDQYWEETQSRYVAEQQAAFYEWLGWFDFGMRAVDRMEKSSHPDEQKAAEWFRRHMQKVWETRPTEF